MLPVLYLYFAGPKRFELRFATVRWSSRRSKATTAVIATRSRSPIWTCSSGISSSVPSPGSASGSSQASRRFLRNRMAQSHRHLFQPSGELFLIEEWSDLRHISWPCCCQRYSRVRGVGWVFRDQVVNSLTLAAGVAVPPVERVADDAGAEM
jgi:hypothetical protein